MAKTLGEMMGEVMKLANRTDTEKETVVKQAINRRYKQILRRYAWPELVGETTVTVSSEVVGLPANVDKILRLYDRANDRVILPLPDTDLTERFINTIGSGTGVSCYYSRLGTRGVHTQPSAAARLTATSDLAGDNLVYKYRIKGYKDGLMFEDETFVGGSTANLYDEVVSFSKESGTGGTVTLVSVESTPVTMGAIAPKECVSRYPIIRLHPIPTSETVLNMVFSIMVDDLEIDNDSTILPCEDILVVGAFSDLLKNLRQFAQAGVEEGRFQELLEDFTKDRINEDNSFMFMPDMNVRTGRV